MGCVDNVFKNVFTNACSACSAIFSDVIDEQDARDIKGKQLGMLKETIPRRDVTLVTRRDAVTH
jgi:hypothetical protein